MSVGDSILETKQGEEKRKWGEQRGARLLGRDDIWAETWRIWEGKLRGQLVMECLRLRKQQVEEP